MKPIRNSIKAIIIEQGKIFLTKNKDKKGFFYLLPGGGQEPGENMKNALLRECLEEINKEIEIIDLLLVREYIGKNHEFSKWDKDVHQIEYMFKCDVKGERSIEMGENPDIMQEDVEWVLLKKLKNIRIYPNILKELFNEDGSLKQGSRYLGDVN